MSRQETIDKTVAAMRSALHAGQIVDRRAIAAVVKMAPFSPEFGPIFGIAKNRILSEDGIDLQPQHKRGGKGGEYLPAEPKDSVLRAGRDCRASKRKLERGKAKIEAVKIEELPPDLRQSATRMKAKTGELLAQAELNNRRRVFTPPAPPMRERRPGITVKDFQALVDGVASIKAGLEATAKEKTHGKG